MDAELTLTTADTNHLAASSFEVPNVNDLKPGQ